MSSEGDRMSKTGQDAFIRRLRDPNTSEEGAAVPVS